MIDSKQKNLPELFGWLMELGCFSEAEIYTTSDGFCAVTTSIADILAHRDITTVPGGSPYASAIRADMSIGDAEFAGPTPYYRPDSRIVRKQYHCHKNDKEKKISRNKTLQER